MMEPAAYGAAVMFGPHTSNFRDTVEQLLRHDAARRVTDADDLALGLMADLEDPEAAAARGAAGRRLVLAQHGGTPGPHRSPSSTAWSSRRPRAPPLEGLLAFSQGNR